MTIEAKKPCLSCHDILPLSAFYWDKRWTPWRRRSRCISCMCLHQGRWNSKRETERMVYKRQRRASGRKDG